jgi:hypothetical protein
LVTLSLAVIWIYLIKEGPKKEPFLDVIVRSKIEYQIPDTMQVFRDFTIKASISKSNDSAILFKAFNNEGGGTKKLRISSRVKLRLIDPSSKKNFVIIPLTTEEQIVNDRANTYWQWNVSPRKKGIHKLLLIVTVIIFEGDIRSEKDVEIIEKKIKVDPSMWATINQFLTLNWQWIITVLIVPIFAMLLKNFFTLKEKRRYAKHNHRKKK